MSFNSENRHILYLGENNMLYWPLSRASIGACRAYFELNGISAGDIISGARLSFGDGKETGIVSLSTDFNNLLDGDGWFTIDGKKLDTVPVRKGLYIYGGHKVVIK